MKDFILADRFLQSCIDLPEDLRRKIVSRLRALARDPRNRRLGVARVEGSGSILSLPVDEGYRIFFRREKQATILLSVAGLVSNFGMNADLIVIASVDALEKLLVEEKFASGEASSDSSCRDNGSPVSHRGDRRGRRRSSAAGGAPLSELVGQPKDG